MSLASDYVIETKDLVKIYKTGKVKAVDGLDFKIKKGEIYALIGANGSGKTTLLNMIIGALYPTSGDISVFGYSIPKYRRTTSNYISVAPQEYSLFAWEEVYSQASLLCFQAPFLSHPASFKFLETQHHFFFWRKNPSKALLME